MANRPTVVEKHNFSGSRLQIKKQSSEAALTLLMKILDPAER